MHPATPLLYRFLHWQLKWGILHTAELHTGHLGLVLRISIQPGGWFAEHTFLIFRHSLHRIHAHTHSRREESKCSFTAAPVNIQGLLNVAPEPKLQKRLYLIWVTEARSARRPIVMLKKQQRWLSSLTGVLNKKISHHFYPNKAASSLLLTPTAIF